LFRFPTELGIDPEKRLGIIFKDMSFVKFPMLEGIAPEKWL
jgi:hypothetical protein